MRTFPDTRLLAAALGWTAVAVATVVFPALWPALFAALAVVVALIVWDLLLLARIPAPAVERRMPSRAYVGRETEIRLLIENRSPDPIRFELVEEVPRDLRAEEPFFGAGVGPRETVALTYAIRPAMRGDRPIGPAAVLVRSPLGFFRRRDAGAEGETLRVYPDVSRLLRPQALDPRRVFAAVGLRPSRRRGEGMEFESLRDAVAGDDPRRIDWAASARRGRPVTRLYRHERHRTVMLALDASRLMAGRAGESTKLDHAIDAALALAYAALASGDRVGMIVFDRETRGHVTPRSHRSELGVFIELLRTVEPRLVEADYRALVRSLAARQRALVVLFTDFVEADAAALTEPLAQLARRHRVLLVAVRDPVFDSLEGDRGREAPRSRDLHRRIVLDDLLQERETALGLLRRRGLQTLDLVPEAITAAVLNRYLAIRDGAER